MRFLIPLGGDIGGAYGVLTSYQHKAVPVSIKREKPWAGDNCAFTGFDDRRFVAWLDAMQPYRATCLFVAVPDVVADATATLARYAEWRERIDYPLAYVAQDGSESLPIPDDCSAVFIGGSTEWKLSAEAVSVIKRAQGLGKMIHIGRINWWKRYSHFRLLQGSELFSCDGTRQRFEGKEKALRAWYGYESQPPLIKLEEF